MAPQHALTTTLAAALALSLPAGVAAAQHVEQRRGYIQDDCGELAGTLIIDGREFRITTRGSIRAQIVDAFRCAGYRARGNGLEVGARYDCRPPTVCWRAGTYDATIDRCDGVVTVRLCKRPVARTLPHYPHRGIEPACGVRLHVPRAQVCRSNWSVSFRW